MRRGRPRRGAARRLEGPKGGRVRGRGRRRHVREPRLRAVQGATRRVWPRARDARHEAPGRAGHPGGRGVVRPRQGGRAREQPGQQGEGQPGGLAHCAGRHRLPEQGRARFANLGEAGWLRQDGQRQERHPGDGLGALRAARRQGGWQDGLHLGRGPQARVGARLGRDHRLWLHRPRVFRRVHGAWLRGDLHRGDAQDDAGLRQADRAAGRPAADQAARDRLVHKCLRFRGDPRRTRRQAVRREDDRRQDQGARRHDRG
mmetsp:Transcript_22230/g.48498  ORF Transcript_22230/g.48498 Transcript_22230/m.48498 type:complete len:259 (+) Transcript_22230:186-962(+)